MYMYSAAVSMVVFKYDVGRKEQASCWIGMMFLSVYPVHG